MVRLFYLFITLFVGLSALSAHGQSFGELSLHFDAYSTTQLHNRGEVQNKLSFDGAVHLDFCHQEAALPLQAAELTTKGQPTPVMIAVEQAEPLSNAELALVDTSALLSLNQALSLPLLETSATIRGQDKPYWYVLPYFKNDQGQWAKAYSATLTWGVSAERSHYLAKGGTRGSGEDEEQAPVFAPTSVMRDGDWYKLALTESGVYKIDYAMLSTMGADPARLDPNDLHVHGYGGINLPYANEAHRPADIPETAIEVVGGSDGSFDGGDYLLFYGHGLGKWSWKESEGMYTYSSNPYTDTAYYFLGIYSQQGKRLQEEELGTEPATPDTTLSDFTALYHHELNKVNLIASGRKWYGEQFNLTTERNISFPIGPLSARGAVKARISVIGQSKRTSTNYSYSLNQQDLGQAAVGKIGSNRYAAVAKTNTSTYSMPVSQLASASQLNLGIRYNKSGDASANGYLDYLSLEVPEALVFQDNLIIRPPIVSAGDIGSVQYELSAPETFRVWNISDRFEARVESVSQQGNRYVFRTKGLNRTDRFVAFRDSKVPSPKVVGKVDNQNLHADEAPDLLIVCHPSFKTQADRLAKHRRSQGLDVVVREIGPIYNEFSSGQQDVTAIRDYARSLYLKDPAKMRYLLLFGDCSYDYKNGVASFGNKVPCYEYKYSFDEIDSKSADDFFGLMDANEGAIPERGSSLSASNYGMDLGVGRLTVNTQQEARQVVDKLLAYDNQKKRLGAWRNRIVFVADDEDGSTHMEQSNDLANRMEREDPSFHPVKLFLDAFQQKPFPGGARAPALNTALKDNLNKGALVTNYTGHGSEFLWADEQIFRFDDIATLENEDNLSFFVTATCDFGKYDDPNLVSGGEQLLIQDKVGAISGMITTRPVFSYQNKQINNAFYNSIFKKRQGAWPRLGDVYINTKNGAISQNNVGFALLGDPSLRLAYPSHRIVVDSLNEGVFTSNSDTVSALQRVKLSGHIEDFQGMGLSGFNGQSRLVFYDKAQRISTLQENFTYQDQSSIIYDGQATVEQGLWSIEFVVPKDINYLLGEGKLSLYAQDPTSLEDAHGAAFLTVGGTDLTAAKDNTPPKIQLYMGSRDFKPGDVTGPEPLLIADFEDEHGINASGTGIGHDLVAIVDGNESYPYVLNQAYQAEQDNFRRGSLEHQLNTLAPGRHEICVRAWDTYNNMGESCTEFVVRSDEEIYIEEVLAVPNPANGGRVAFHINHNMGGQDMKVSLRIVSLTGREVYRNALTLDHAPGRLHAGQGLEWLTQDAAEGMYIAHIRLESHNKTKTANVKIVVN